jgi:hypothetical protein
MLHATILEVDTQSNFTIAGDVARKVASCVRTFIIRNNQKDAGYTFTHNALQT